MDHITRQLVDYTVGFSLAAVPTAASQAALNHLVDAVGCAIAGYRTESAQVGVRVARTVTSGRPATVFGAGVVSAPAYAAMANTIMVRSLDWNDGMLAKGGGHPSDMIPAIVGAAEVCAAPGAAVLEGTLLAYELLGGIGNVAPSNRRGWDQGLFMGVATALAVGRIHGLTAAQLGHAVSLAVVPAVPLLVTRRGALSMWKGAATSAAILNAVNAVALAQEGMTGPAEPFVGTMGVFEQLTGPWELVLPADPGGRFVTEISHLKQYPAESHAQSLLGLMPAVRRWREVGEIASIEIECYWEMWNAIGSHESIYDPQNRETADHSLPYLLAVALTDGDVGVGSFSAERIADPGLRPLMRKITVRENPGYTARYRPPERGLAAEPHVRVTVRAADGAVLEEELTYPKGHPRNPMTRADVDTKLARICAGVLKDDHRDRIREAWWGIESLDAASEAVQTLARFA
jgi:2-methylcitrate dehydratase